MPAVKKYTRVNFQNYPSTSTPLNATNLNKMDKGIDDLDDEVVAVKNTIENMSFDANAISYDNTQSGLQATDVQGAVDEINDNLAGFKFYPTGTNLVALISDDSFYTDANGKYVVWGTATANQLVEDNPGVYKSLASTEDCRGKVGADTVSPFRSKISLTILGGGSGSNSYRAGILDVDNTHNYSKLKVIEYIRIENAQNNNYPRFTIGTTSYSRPAVGTVLDISQQSVNIACTSKDNMSNWDNYGVKVELS